MTKTKKIVFNLEKSGFKIAEGIELRKNPLSILSNKVKSIEVDVEDLIHHVRHATGDEAEINALVIIALIDNSLAEATKKLKGVDADLVIEHLAQLRHRYGKLANELPEVPSVLEAATKKTTKNAINEVKDIDRDTIRELIEDTWLGAVAGKHGEDAEFAYKIISKHLDLGKKPVIDEITDILVKIKNEPRFGGVMSQFDKHAITKLDDVAYLRGQVSAFKGKLYELWFFSHPFWTRFYQHKLLTKALHRAYRLSKAGQKYKPLTITTPLFLGGKEIYDGAIAVVRSADSGIPNHFEGFLDSAIQIKAEVSSSFLKQTVRDWVRENPGQELLLKFEAHGQTNHLTLLPEPEVFPLRVFVAPHVPTGSTWDDVPIPGQATMIQSPLTAEHADIIFLTMIEAMRKLYPI